MKATVEPRGLAAPRTQGGILSDVRTRRSLLHTVLHIVFLVLCVIYLLPFVWMISTSLKMDGREMVMPPEWIPNPAVWSNYTDALYGRGVPMLLFLRNTLVIGITATIGGLLSASLAGFAFARLRFPGRDVLFMFCLSTLMLPSIVTLIPEFLLYRGIGWLNTFWPMIIPWTLGGHAFGIFLFRQYCLTIPQDFDEAARVDGATAFRIWWSIILPLSKPVLATIAILSFIHHWNDFLRPLVLLTSKDLRTLAIGLRLFRSEYLVQWNLMMAASALMLIPILILFFSAQRYFVQGIVMTGIKG
jgi:ABC-type glycerol-3-phosphate transport system permease component